MAENECQHDTRIAGKSTSLWLDTTPRTDYPPLDGDREVDVAVVGGGLAGFLAALKLMEVDRDVVVLERHRIAESVTGLTTAKITSSHGLIYAYLIKKFGEKKARQYAEANQVAIDRYEEVVREYGIECDFERMPSFTYSSAENGDQEVQTELEAAEQLGLPVSLVDNTTFPFPVGKAIRFEDQARFHPRKFLLFLAEIIQNGGGEVFEHTAVMGIENNDRVTIRTDHGTITANQVIVTTNFPIYDPIKVFARTRPRQSYLLGVRLNGPVPYGMWYDDADSFHSFRSHPWRENEEILLVGGELHQTGGGGSTTERYIRLEQWAREHFDVKSVEYHWSTHDVEVFDRVPFIGEFEKNVYGATGFKGWGMSHSMVAAMMISDLMAGRKNPWTEVFDPKRSVAKTEPIQTIKQNIGVGREFVEHRIEKVPEKPEDLEPGQGAVLDIDGQKTAVYRSEDGTISMHSAKCTHLGCIISFNDAEKTWDCPCHGSRFNCHGEVIQSPAIKNLSEVNRKKSQS